MPMRSGKCYRRGILRFKQLSGRYELFEITAKHVRYHIKIRSVIYFIRLRLIILEIGVARMVLRTIVEATRAG